MKKFVYLFQGWEEPTPEVMSAWKGWFDSIGEHVVDGGNPFGPGREVTPSGSRAITPEMAPAVGYSIVNAETIDAAEKLLEGCPIIDSVRVYEAVAM